MNVVDSWLELRGQPPMSIGSRISWHSKELRNCRALTRQRRLIWSDYHQPSAPRSPLSWICKIFPLRRKTSETKDSTCKRSITPIPMTRHDPPLLISRLLQITKKFGQRSTSLSPPICSSPSWKSRSLTFAGIGLGMGRSRRRTSQLLPSRPVKNGPQRHSRLVKILNLPQRVRLRFDLPAACWMTILTSLQKLILLRHMY
jgi:hypothetical protein